MSRYGESKVYVGDLGSNASKPELEDVFGYYGRLRNVWVARNPPGFAFVEFEDPRDAEDAIRGLDGRTICGRRARVELSNGGRFSSRAAPRSRYSRPVDDRCYDCGDRGHYARDCTRRRRRSRSRSPRRSRSRSNSRSRSRSPRSRSRSRSGRSRSRSKPRSAATRSRSGSKDSRKSG